MRNEESFNFFKGLIDKDSSAGSEKYGHDYSRIDADFILKYVDLTTSVLDIGSGSGLIINKIEPFVAHIIAIEPFKEFTEHIKESDKITILNLNIFDFESEQMFDLITLFGVMHYVNQDEAEIIYNKCLRWLNPSGRLIIKNQFGIREDVIVNGYSTELQADYYANYRDINQEIAFLSDIGFLSVNSFDIYPVEANRWSNTHFYAIVAEK